MKRTITALAVGGLLLTAGCSSNDAKSETKQLNGLQSYATVQELADDLAAGGIECDRTERRDTSKYAAESISCFNNGHEYVLNIHLSEKDRDAQVSVNETLLGSAGLSYGVISGTNWTVNCGDPDRCQTVKQIIGGKVTAEKGK
ncbi:hypothetical protein GS491_00735 [Rhodococcus hoagii]|nr:hypothetical protein [Prescottella equi]NKT03123.1 hypothetical protein [Prescottella equi]